MSELPHENQELDAADDAFTRRLSGEIPRASQSLRRRVRDRVADAVGRQAMKRRSGALIACGVVLLIVAVVLSFSGSG